MAAGQAEQAHRADTAKKYPGIHDVETKARTSFCARGTSCYLRRRTVQAMQVVTSAPLEMFSLWRTDIGWPVFLTGAAGPEAA
ncbi:hypothetical protein QT196_06380 [Streptomyces sp. P9-2B-2]|uniref:hypothetical protein n=1 Tax=Streptomyces sp. P9-2B-2 TaxID=3057114 RepID=UPI0025B39661|nr:hypothetical protein [Streptomyces sp. P9-2B-2]WJY36934.1 hypothetical protein QT196_06380 [Streptomyces sp. P9-2B-2]